MTEINLTPEELESMLDRAAKRGAKQALSSIGLHDATAAKDINEMRDLLDVWPIHAEVSGLLWSR